jgi:hypothetical protein
MSYPDVLNPQRVGDYPARAFAGGGYVWDEVLEYRVWCHPEQGAPDLCEGSDYFHAFGSHAEAQAFSDDTTGAEEPLALVLQREYIDEAEDGLLRRPRRTPRTIPDFLAPDAPPNRLDILRGLV